MIMNWRRKQKYFRYFLESNYCDIRIFNIPILFIGSRTLLAVLGKKQKASKLDNLTVKYRQQYVTRY